MGAVINENHLNGKVYAWLQERILHHLFLPGDKLDIPQIAEELGVSRTPVKEAINRLTVEGLVTLRNRRGTFVATLTEQAMHELIEARMMIESWAVDHLTLDAMIGAKHRVALMLDRIERSLLITKASLFDGDESYRLDREWHALLVQLAGNQTILEMHQKISARLHVGSLYFLSDEEAFERTRIIHVEHARMMRAFLDDDRAELGEAVALHIRNSETEYRRLLQRFDQRQRELRSHTRLRSG
jgi:DNA-binding GntR family transcriptional regulator